MGGLEPSFTAPRLYGRDGEAGFGGRTGSPAGYDLYEIQREASYPFLRRADAASATRSRHSFDARPGESRESVGRWIFIPGGLARAAAIIRRASPADLLVVDEFGRLELEGGGVRAALDEALGVPGRRAIIVVRGELRAAFRAAYPAAGAKAYDVRRPGVEDEITRDFFGETG